MALSKMAMKQPEMEEDDYEESEDLDNEIAFGLMANTLLQQEGQQGLAEAMNQGNPVPVIASMLAALVSELAKKFESSDMSIDQGVWLAPDGAVERTIDFIDELVGPLEEDMKTAIFSDVVDQIKLFKNQGTPGSAGALSPGSMPQQPPQGAPPMPMGQPPMPGQAQAGGMV